LLQSVGRCYGLAIDSGRQRLYYAAYDNSGGKVGELTLTLPLTRTRVLSSDSDSRPKDVVLDVENRSTTLAMFLSFNSV